MNTKYNLWTITDGSQGMISQTNGLAQNLFEEFKEKKIELKWPWSRLQPGFLPVYKNIFNFDFIETDLPKIVISCGRKSIYASLYLKKILKQKLISIHIQNPKISTNNFDYVISPNHDRLSGNNVIKSTGALHHLSLLKINNSKKLFECPSNKKIVTILLGGENNHYDFNTSIINNLVSKIEKLNNRIKNLYFLFISSRRTNENAMKNLLKYNIKDNFYIWDGKSSNPYLYSLKIADYFIITSDSTSMISEASITGKPIFIFNLPYKRKSNRLKNFHSEFNKLGITRPFLDNLSEWTYKSLNESERIAGILKPRILELKNE